MLKSSLRMGAIATALIMTSPLLADGGVTFTDIAEGDGAGIDYRRQASVRSAIREASVAMSPIANPAFFTVVRPTMTPQKGRGAPGVALLDYDRDGDTDIYVANGPGAANALYSNQLIETGSVTFVDMAAAAGVEAFTQDSSGVCFGDLDNDGDEDLYVLGTGEEGLLFENFGNGAFANVTAAAGVGGGARHSVACTMLDADNDGLLDIVIGNSYSTWDHRIAVFGPGPTTYPLMEHNQLFMNQGGMVFTDESAARGLEQAAPLTGVPGTTGAAFTWAIGSADYDLDGDVDIFSMDNQGPAPSMPSENRGYIRIYNNDGAGNFTEVTEAAGTNVNGGWMGVDFGDFNCDGGMDFFATDLGFLGLAPSRWFTSNNDGTFTDSGAGNLTMTPFGWGVSTLDYDNDADTDVIYHGGVDIFSIIITDNPGALLQNTGVCSGDFAYDANAILTPDHNLRMVQGVAVGDLNNDGFEDMVSVSNHDIAPVLQLPITIISGVTGSVFDTGTFELSFSGQANPGFQTYIGPMDAMGNPIPHPDGTLSVEINSADNGNGSATIGVLGTKGLTYGGDVNRDGIGATLTFTPDGGPTSMQPVVGGASYASQNALTSTFGMGLAEEGNVDVLWPGGVSNRLYDVENGERILFPEIPCDFRDSGRFGRYLGCVAWSLLELRWQGVIDNKEKRRFFKSALRAYIDEHHN